MAVNFEIGQFFYHSATSFLAIPELPNIKEENI
jgi:hypothetical protein